MHTLSHVKHTIIIWYVLGLNYRIYQLSKRFHIFIGGQPKLGTDASVMSNLLQNSMLM